MKKIKAFFALFRKLYHYLKRKYFQLISWVKKIGPGPKVTKGSLIAVFATMILLTAYSNVFLRTGYGIIVDFIIGAVIGAIAGILLIIGVRLILRIVKNIPIFYGSLIIAGFISLLMSIGLSPRDALFINIWLFFSVAFIGGSIVVLFVKKFRTTGKRKIFIASIFLLTGLIGTGGFLFWVLSEGTDKEIVKVDIYPYDHIKTIDYPDPSQPGANKVEYISYGSGEDRRQIFGENVDIKTHRIDGKAFVNKLPGFFGKMRKKFWGFNRTKFPLNGRVWYPDSEGKFPLVLVVHGNHSMREYSDPGYEYLGELLASRGYIFVSVDENFLNGDWLKNYRTENDARGWVMLEHLKLWREWNKDINNRFYKKVDMDNISLIGHSRGGEAVSIAAAFNKLKNYPDDAKIKFDYGFNIKSIIPIAPCDGQYNPSDQSTPLENINYFVIHGSHDADVSNFSGDKQYKRIKFNDSIYHFKSSLYVYRANHGQFNTVWGKRDWGLPGGYLLNTKELISGEKQRQVAKVYISAFLDLTLKGDMSFLPLFKDYRYAKHWLPETLYINRFEDSETSFLCDYDEDIDVTTSTVENGYLHGDNLALWHEEDIGFRSGRSLRQNQAVYLGWEYPDDDSLKMDSLKMNSPASYTVKLPENINESIKVNKTSVFTFSIIHPDQKPPKPDSLDRKEYNED